MVPASAHMARRGQPGRIRLGTTGLSATLHGHMARRGQPGRIREER